MGRHFFISMLLLLGCRISGQVNRYPDPANYEIRLQSLFERLYADSVPAKQPVNEQILRIMPEALSSEGAMNHSWSRLDRIGIITSEDKRIRIFTWHLSEDPDTYRYFGYIQVAQRRGGVKVFPLVDNQKKQRGVYNLDQSTGEWYGKLYYGIVMTSVKRKVYYTLLGMDFNDSRSNFKTVEVLMLQRNRPVFARQMFFNGRDRVDRVILEYSDQVAMTVRYDPGLEMIAFDHLAPFHPVYENNFEFYGPDGSFDGLEFSKGSWIYREDIDARLHY
jgi:hypothetical protein